MTPFDKLQVFTWLILVDVYIQVRVLDEVGAGFGRLEVMNECILSHSKLDSVTNRLLLRLEDDDVMHHTGLEMVHVPLLVRSEVLDEALERLARLGWRRVRAPPKELGYAVLQNLIDEVLISEGFLFLSVLSDDAHDLTEAVLVINGHLNTGEWLSFIQEQIDVSSHLLLLLIRYRHYL